MLLTKYGEFDFHYNGVKYFGKPSFGCIAGVGTPKEIINTVKVICSPARYHDTYREAFNLLQLCADKPLPKEWEPKLYINKQGSKTIPKHVDSEVQTFVINFAKHCIVHAMNGKPKDTVESVGKTEIVTEFDPYEWIESAIELLGMTTEQAANLSMTEYIARIESKPWYKEARKKDKGNKAPDINEIKRLMRQQEEMDRKQKEKLKAAN